MAIILDIETPRCCGLCPCFHAEHPMYCQAAKHITARENVKEYQRGISRPYETRPEWCPLGDVQKEDAISRSNLQKRIEWYVPIHASEYANGIRVGLECALEELKKAPTIIGGDKGVK